ncbi:MAG: PD-(D/E)XK nuclease family protein, partial [Treponema sp.]|nr:PD-(D/E)XK nuclease family protein [Treponema sp.]
MNPVISTIKEHIADQNVRFVFPSQTAAALWARKTCTLGIVRSVAGNRFLAWDRFKEEVIRERDSRREPVSALIRKLFAEALVRKNAEIVSGAGGQGLSRKSGGFPLQSLIPQEYARGGSIFAPAIARFLPSLFMWEKLTKTVPGYRAESEDEDYQTIKNEYAIFLEHYKLFEPSWEEIKIRGGDRQYLIFFPELIEDFAEYDALLAEPQFIRIKAGEAPVPEGLFLLSYQSAREEIRSAVMELRRLHEEEGVPYEDMAVSVPELEEMEPCLLKEFSLRHIPVTRRAGKNLGESGAGRLFSLLNECAASQFSFNSLKALVLNDHIPWKERKKNKALINFGIRYNCVSCYAEQGKVKDIWEEAFREAYNDGGRELRQYYRDLKKAVMSITGAETFADIRKYYFTFRGRLLDMEKISPEDDAVLSRCVEELGAIIDLEEKFSDPALVPSAPFGFFVSCLGEKEYVLAGQQPGVNIFKWRVAAASPFGCHFVLNASQSAAAILYQPMQFLRQDKRKALGLEDRDATGAFFLLCDTGEEKDYKCHCRISAAAQTFSGWAIPHSFFAQGKTADSQSSKQQGEGEDPYREERRFWREAGNPEGTPEGHTRDGYTPGSRAGGLQRIFPLQKKSFEIWKEALTQKKNNFSFFGSPVTGAGADSVRQLLEDAVMGKDGCLTVTPTRDLNVYYRCPVFWLYSRIFGLEEFSLEAALLDDTSLGLLYHAILENLFARIRDEDGVFDSRRLGTYKKWALEITRSAIREHPAFRGPLAVPLVSPQAAGMSKKIAELLVLEAQYFGGYR